MNHKRKTSVALGIALIVVAGILSFIVKTAGGSLDVVGTESVVSFEKILTASADNVVKEENAAWSLEAPDQSVRFQWSGEENSDRSKDVVLQFDIAPFENAGLDIAKLPDYYEMNDSVLAVGTKFGDGKSAGQVASTPLEAYEKVLRKSPDSIGYHTALDHFNVNLGNGNLFEWAKDMQFNRVTKESQDKDIVFVLNPEPLIAAGVDPEKVEGWLYTTVNVGMGAMEKEVYKFLKPFNLQ